MCERERYDVVQLSYVSHDHNIVSVKWARHMSLHFKFSIHVYRIWTNPDSLAPVPQTYIVMYQYFLYINCSPAMCTTVITHRQECLDIVFRIHYHLLTIIITTQYPQCMSGRSALSPACSIARSVFIAKP